jgi:hypothetical protein
VHSNGHEVNTCYTYTILKSLIHTSQQLDNGGDTTIPSLCQDFFRTYLVRPTMSNGRMTINDESKRMWKEAIVTVPTVYSRIFLEGLRQTMNNVCHNNLAARLRIVPGSTKHDAGVPTASPRRSVFYIYYFNRESLNISAAVKSGKCRPSELSSGLYCRVKWLSTDVSEVRTASIIRDRSGIRRQLWTSYSPPWELEISQMQTYFNNIRVKFGV